MVYLAPSLARAVSGVVLNVCLLTLSILADLLLSGDAEGMPQ